ncbi:MAG: type II secretion system minor pseudopilin GspI [Candidatus Hydrogenedentota bacterium]|nr:MAG: type II secretion system minor pseudopilin GspI [Candidatus Hydrogenedentota bacterium]
MIVHRSNRGFTLLEVIVALGIIATALVTLLGTHLMSLNLAQKHREQTLATLLARQKMEEIMTIPFDSLATDSGEFGSAYPNYEWKLDVEDTDTENLKKIRIVIKLPDEEFELETLVARGFVE